MPQAPGRTMPQAPGSTMPQAGNRPTVLPSGATPYNVQPRAPNSDNSEGQRGPQTGGGFPDLRQQSGGQAHRWQDYDDTPKRDPRKAFSLTGMQAAYEKGQQPGGEFRRSPERYVEEPMLNFEQREAKRKATLAEQGGVTRVSDEVLESMKLPENLKSYVKQMGGIPEGDSDYFQRATSQIQDPEAYKRDFGELPEFSPSRTGGQQSGRQEPDMPQSGGGGFDPRTYGSGPRTGGPGATLQQGGGRQSGGQEPDMPQSRSKFFNGGSQTGGCGVFSTPAPRAPSQMMAKGGSIKAKKGGSVKSKSASSRGDGCAQRGKTRGKMV